MKIKIALFLFMLCLGIYTFGGDSDIVEITKTEFPESTYLYFYREKTKLDNLSILAVSAPAYFNDCVDNFGEIQKQPKFEKYLKGGFGPGGESKSVKNWIPEGQWNKLSQEERMFYSLSVFNHGRPVSGSIVNPFYSYEIDINNKGVKNKRYLGVLPTGSFTIKNGKPVETKKPDYKYIYSSKQNCFYVYVSQQAPLYSGKQRPATAMGKGNTISQFYVLSNKYSDYFQLDKLFVFERPFGNPFILKKEIDTRIVNMLWLDNNKLGIFTNDGRLVIYNTLKNTWSLPIKLIKSDLIKVIQRDGELLMYGKKDSELYTWRIPEKNNKKYSIIEKSSESILIESADKIFINKDQQGNIWIIKQEADRLFVNIERKWLGLFSLPPNSSITDIAILYKGGDLLCFISVKIDNSSELFCCSINPHNH